MAGAVGLSLVAILGWQHAVFSDELDGLQYRLDRVERDIEKAKAARQHPIRLAEEVERYEDQLSELCRLMPAAVSLDGVALEVTDQLEALARE